MFVALRDLRHARGRFALVGVVVLLISFLVTFLGALTAGLARESTSAITELPVDHLAFAMPAPTDAPGFTASAVEPEQWQRWSTVPGVLSAQPVGILTTRATSPATTAAVTALGVRPASGLLPGGAEVAKGAVVLSTGAAADLDARTGGRVTVGGRALVVSDVVDVEASFSHTPVVWVDLADWQQVAGRAADGDGATVIALSTQGLSEADIARADDAVGTTTVTTSAARSAVSSFTAENMSLTIMLAFLIVISALVVGAFFTVWTISRSGDLAVLKALGASTSYLLRDALAQAAIVLVGGVALGTSAAAAAATALSGFVPVVVDPATVAVPAAGLLTLGLLGAAVSVVRIGRIDPHAALAAGR